MLVYVSVCHGRCFELYYVLLKLIFNSISYLRWCCCCSYLVTFLSPTISPLSILFWVFFLLFLYRAPFYTLFTVADISFFNIALHKSLVIYITVWSRRLSPKFSYYCLLFAYMRFFSLSLSFILLLPHCSTEQSVLLPQYLCIVCFMCVCYSSLHPKWYTLAAHPMSYCSLLANHMRDPSIYWFIVTGSIHFSAV